MNIDCRVIGDLLPLYADESCSDASRALVDDHLKTCPRCRETLARMKSEQFLPAAQAIDPPAVADYAQKVKHRRQKRGTLPDCRRHRPDRIALARRRRVDEPCPRTAPLHPRG